MISAFFAAICNFLYFLTIAICEALAEVYDDHDGYKS